MYDRVLKMKHIIDHEDHEVLTFIIFLEQLCSVHVMSCGNNVEYGNNTINIRCLTILHDEQGKWKTFLNSSAQI